MARGLLGSLLSASFKVRVVLVRVEVVTAVFVLGTSFYTPLAEQYYYHSYGYGQLKNTSFVFPNGSVCISSEMINNYTGNNDSYKLDQTFSSHLLIYGQVVFTISSVFVTIALGSLTDIFGRKIGLALPSLGGMMQGLWSLLVVKFNLSPYYFIIGYFVSGMTGGYASAIASATSYIADVSSLRWRTLRIAIIESGIAFGRGMGQLTVGYWLEESKCNFIPLLCFYTALFAFLSIYGILIPDTHSERKERNPKKEPSWPSILH